MALMPADHTVSRFVLKKIYSVVITRREESSNGHEPFEITNIKVFTEGLDMNAILLVAENVSDKTSKIATFKSNPRVRVSVLNSYIIST